MGSVNDLRADQLGQAFREVLSPLTEKLVSTQVDWDSKTRKVLGSDLHIGYLGIVVDGEEPSDEDQAKFGRLLNWLVREDLIQHGVLCLPIWLNLAPTCSVCEKFWATLSSVPSEEVHASCIESSGSTLPPLQQRVLMLTYPATRFSREELNRRLHNGNFTEEGQFPPKGWPAFE